METTTLMLSEIEGWRNRWWRRRNQWWTWMWGMNILWMNDNRFLILFSQEIFYFISMLICYLILFYIILTYDVPQIFVDFISMGIKMLVLKIRVLKV